ncbi:uncharacterized protein RAG0_00685 [Rhynchosporium agropyri]|uniref:2EXR domain-containing protein n=1 Tax=Rhynchosporium agropyri TaxID=914238 RepID=A0A1E1JTT0_9HELO|nr:uncharacterized protein RAG0_00685 [Rhynchosporium agropyri]
MSDLATYKLTYRPYEGARPLQSFVPDPEQQRTFTCFSKLPNELRFKIWKLLAPEPRIIVIAPHGLFCPPRSEGKNQVPSVLHVNRESRTHTCLSYTVEDTFEDPLGCIDFNPNTSNRKGIYVSWKHDIICPLDPNRLQMILKNPHIRKVAMNVGQLTNFTSELDSDGYLKIPTLARMLNLEEVIVYDLDFPQNYGGVLILEEVNESQLLRELCQMSKNKRASMGYLLATRKAVHKDFAVTGEKLKTRSGPLREGEKGPFKFWILSKRLEGKKRPVVKLAFVRVNKRMYRSRFSVLNPTDIVWS